jgi:hypothetical protein
MQTKLEIQTKPTQTQLDTQTLATQIQETILQPQLQGHQSQQSSSQSEHSL